MNIFKILSAVTLFGLIGLASGQSSVPTIKKLAIDQNLGGQVPMDAQFTDEHGKQIRLGDVFHGRPVILMPIFYTCQGVCGIELDSMVKDAVRMKNTYRIGDKFDLVAVSIKPTETPDLALAKEKELQKAYNMPGTEQGWHLLVGKLDQIHRVTDAVGFRYEWDPATDLINHPAGIMVLTPEGKISSYLYGADFPTKVLQDGINIAAAGKVGEKADVILLGCIMVDPRTGKRTLVVEQVMKLSGGLTVLIVGLSILKMSLASKNGGNA